MGEKKNKIEVDSEKVWMILPESGSGDRYYLSEAQGALVEGLRHGTHCQCCGRWSQIYDHSLNKAMVRSLGWLVRASSESRLGVGNGWVDVPNSAPKWLTRTNQLPTTANWRLCERMANDDPKKKKSGIWRPTEKGKAFMSGEILIPARVATLFGNVVAYSREMISVNSVLPNFSYAALMNGSVDIKDF